MPYEVSWEPSGVVQRYSGVVSDEDVIAANREVYANPLLPAMKYQIVDFSLVEKIDVSSATARAVADSDRRVAETNPDVKAAIITSAPFVRGMSNLYATTHEVRGGSWTTKIFEREEDARAWAVPSS
jgi:hypothetical protein